MRFRKSCAAAVRCLAWQTALVYAPLAVALHFAAQRWTIAVNLTESLPGKLFVIRKGPVEPRLGALAAFPLPKRIADAHGYREGSSWVKCIAGLPGERIAVEDRVVYVGGRRIGRALMSGAVSGRLEPVAEGAIPEGQVFLAGAGGNSLDSKYRSFGLLPAASLTGLAIASDADGFVKDAGSASCSAVRPRL